MSGRRPLSRRLRRRRAQVSHQASRPKRPPIRSSAPPTSLPSSTSRRVVHVLGPLLPFFFCAFSRLWVARRTLENAPDLSVLAPRRSRRPASTLPPPPPPAPLRAFLSGRHTILFRVHGGGSMCPLDEAGEIRANPWGMGGGQSNHHATYREREGVRRRSGGGGVRQTGQEKQAGTLQLHKHAKEKKKSVMQQSFDSRRRGCSCRATNFAGVEE